jgi:hypothetical protein
MNKPIDLEKKASWLFPLLVLLYLIYQSNIKARQMDDGVYYSTLAPTTDLFKADISNQHFSDAQRLNIQYSIEADSGDMSVCLLKHDSHTIYFKICNFKAGLNPKVYLQIKQL